MIPDATPSTTSQVATFAVAAYAIAIFAHTAERLGVGVVLALILAAGIAVGISTGVGLRRFQSAPGILLGAITSVVTGVVLGVGFGASGAPQVGPEAMVIIILGAGFFVAGLDWSRVNRLRAVPLFACLPVVVVTLSDRGPVFAFALGWLALAVATLWSLELDQRAAFQDPRSLEPERGGPDVGSRDLAGALGIAMLLGLLFAFSASMPSCSFDLPGFDHGIDQPFDVDGRLPVDRFLTMADIREGGFPFDFSGPVPSIDIGGVEHLLRMGESGMLYLENALTGERFSITPEGENLVVRDAEGNVVSVIRPEPEDEGSSAFPWKPVLIGLVAVVAAGLALRWYLNRRRRPPESPREWAEDVVRRIDRYGRRHGVPRQRSETVVHHTTALAADVAPDPRLVGVGRVVSDALFGRTQPSPEERAWAEQVLDEVAEAHPAPTRLQRRRRAKERRAAAEVRGGG